MGEDSQQDAVVSEPMKSKISCQQGSLWKQAHSAASFHDWVIDRRIGSGDAPKHDLHFVGGTCSVSGWAGPIFGRHQAAEVTQARKTAVQSSLHAQVPQKCPSMQPHKAVHCESGLNGRSTRVTDYRCVPPRFVALVQVSNRNRWYSRN